MGDRTERVLDPGAVLTREDADLRPVRKPRDRVGHVDRDALLANDDRADVRLGRSFDHRVARIRKKQFDAFALEDLRERRGHLHDGSAKRNSKSSLVSDFAIALSALMTERESALLRSASARIFSSTEPAVTIR